METELDSFYEFWKGDFGDKYHKRQSETDVGSVKSNEALFAKILPTRFINTILEFGAGRGLNNEALHNITAAKLWSVELNAEAASHINYGDVIVGDAIDCEIYETCDLVFTKGLLIHLPPKRLAEMYHKLYQSSDKYILICEYYNPTPVEIVYRGNEDRLWKRDFAGEMLDLYPDLELVDYGFVYHRDKNPEDDISWFLMEKIS